MRPNLERCERREAPIEMPKIERLSQIELGLMKEIVSGVIERLGLSPEQLGLAAPEEKKP